MAFKKIKLNYDRLGIITSIACAVHCTILPVCISTLPFLGINILENKTIEWTMIVLAFVFGSLSLYHGYTHHHRKILPLLLFSAGFVFLILNQVIGERFVFIFIPAASISIISAHVINIYHCRISGKCKAHQADTGNTNHHLTSSASRNM